MTVFDRCIREAKVSLMTVGAIAMTFVPSTVLAQEVTIRFATLQSPQNPMSLELKKAFEQVEEATDGRVNFQVHYGSESGFEAKQYISALEYGMLDGALIATSASALEYPWLGVYGIPFLVPDEHARQPMLDATKPMLEAFSQEHGIVPLAYPLHLDKWVVIYSNKDIQSIDDFKGMLIRTYDPNSNALATALGGVPTSIQKSEMYMGLQRGTIDGAITGITAAEEMKLDEVVQYVVQMDVVFLPHILGLSEKTWDKMSPEDQEAVRNVFADWEQEYIAMTNDPERSGDPYAYAKEAGMKIILPGDDMKEVFAGIHEQAVASFVAQDEMSAKVFELIDEAREKATE